MNELKSNRLLELQSSHIRNSVLTITLFAILGGMFVPKAWVQGHIVGFAVGLILGGVPHGASDFLIFRHVLAKQNNGKTKLIFGIGYLMVMLLYGLLWWFSPITAFGIFILISAYHFGQSNWQHVTFKNSVWEKLTYFLWGTMVIGFPVLLHHEQAALIIFEITGIQLQMAAFRTPVLFLLFAFNLINIIQLEEAGLITGRQLTKELTTLFILAGLFLTTPLLIGFGIYFVVWHSLGAVLDQVSILKGFDRTYNFGKYFWKVAPLSVLAFVGLGLLYWMLGDQMNQGVNLGVLFLFISIITVPHSILMDKFYLMNITTNNRKH